MSRRIAYLGLVPLSLIAASLGFAPAVLAEDPPFSDLPLLLMQRMGRGGTLEDFVKDLAQEMQRADFDRNGLDRHDLEVAAQIEAAQYRAMMVQRIVSSDLDGNGEVAKDEATRNITYQMQTVRLDEKEAGAVQKQIGRTIGRLMALDENGDGVVTLAEGMKAVPTEKNVEHQRARSEALLTLDPDKDGRLTLAELEQTARQAFTAVDYNHDGTLGSSEVKLLEPARQFQHKLQQAMPCDLPKPAAQDLVTMLGVYDGVLQPNVTIAGRDATTQLTRLDIEPGSQPLYLVLTSYRPMIWQFSGATERLARVIAIQSRKGKKELETAGAGVVGLAADKVMFLPPGSCGRSYYKAESEEATFMASMAARMTGHAADAVRGVYSARTIALPSGTTSNMSGAENPIILQENRFADEANLVALDPAQVLASDKVETYEVMPEQYGLRQLVKEGKLERTETGYRIVAPISRFPSGLTGAHAVTFLLPEGMPMPGGDAGHSKIILEKKPAQ